MVFPSVARMRIEGAGDSLVLLEASVRRGFWVRKIEPRAFWEVVVRRVEREVKNWGFVSISEWVDEKGRRELGGF